MAVDKNAIQKEAQKFAAKGQFDKAIAEWKKIAKETPNDANVFNTIGDLCLKKNSKAEAVDAYHKAAGILAADGFTSKAIALYKKVLNIDSKKMEAHLALGDLNAEKGLTGNALESYKTVADHYSRNKETAKALGIYQKMADLNASNVAFRLKLADMYAKEGMTKEAVTAYLQAADVHVSKDAFKDARQLFEKALALDPNNKDVYSRAGLVYFKEGKFVEACKALKPAYESDPGNAGVADLYLDALAKAGRGGEAAEVYQKLLAREPDRTDIREKLYRLYLSQEDHDKAFAEVSTLVSARVENKDIEGAEQLLKEFLSQAPKSVSGKRALSAVYKSAGKTEAAAAELVQAAEILIEEGDTDGAKEVLSRALESAPGHAEAAGLLQSLKPDAAGPESVIVDSVSGTLPGAEAELTGMEPEFPSAAPGADPEISGALAEIDVLVKYGLATKALEQLEAMARKFPHSIQVRTRLRDCYGDIGNMGKAVAHMLVLSELYAAQGMQAEADQILQQARGMDPGNPQLRGPAQSDTVALDAPGELQPDDQAGLEGSLQEPTISLDEAPFEAGLPDIGQDLVLEEPGPAEALSPDLTFDQPFAAPDIAPEDPLAVREDGGLPAFDEQNELPAIVPEETAPDGYASGAPAFEEQDAVLSTDPGTDAVNLDEVWAEAEFYYQQGLFDEALKHYEKVVEYAPGNARALDRIAELRREQEQVREFSKLADAVDELEGLEGAGAAPARDGGQDMGLSSSDEEAVRSLMQEIAQLKQKTPPPLKKASSPAKPAAPVPAGSKEDDFFDLGAELGSADAGHAGTPAPAAGPDDFFDLASELRDELSLVSVPALSPGEAESQSLDDIFEDFKKGVEQQTIKEDADTHYNLGIAYKEMGLLDDAIGEFVMTPEDEPKYVQSRYMLGLCFLEQGDYENAIIEIENAARIAESRGVPSHDRIGMMYDLGLAYQGEGSRERALEQFQQVCALDPGYREAAGKVRELQQGNTVSLEQLKGDIEREISSKFLEEGERIEREEKTKKNERVRR